MLEDCRSGKIDLVVTKSITRFARNTVILFETVRELKALDIDVFFEKENMHSISPDGELLLTLLAMYAEEEARSASENQKWRIRKKFKNGEPWVGDMLGYRLIDGKMVIVPEEAEIVKMIFNDYLSGMGVTAIAKKLNAIGIPAKFSEYWRPNVILKIIHNEKYKGDMLLQKTYRPDFRTKKGKGNHGEVPKYYVENSHKAIVDVWYCNQKYTNAVKCQSPVLKQGEIKRAFEMVLSKIKSTNTECSEALWRELVDRVIVQDDRILDFHLNNGQEIKIALSR